MATTPKVRVRPIISEASIKKAEKNRLRLSDLIEEVSKQPCPQCGRASLAFDSELFWSPTGGIVIYCQRPLCSYKPFNTFKELQPPRKT
jgi:hypothetical protein